MLQPSSSLPLLPAAAELCSYTTLAQSMEGEAHPRHCPGPGMGRDACRVAAKGCAWGAGPWGIFNKCVLMVSGSPADRAN